MSDASSPVTLTPIDGVPAALAMYTHDPDRDLVSRRLRDERRWEPFETSLWLAAQRPGDVVVDVGANLGYFTLLSALAEAPPSAVFAFEPAADNVELLHANLELNGCRDRVDVVHGALAQEAGAGTLWRSGANAGDHQIYHGDGDRDGERIRLLRGDEFLAPRVPHIDLLKVDTQGSEVAVLRGLWPLLERSRERLRLLVELTPYSLRLAGASGRELVELLAELDLPLSIVDHVAHRSVPTTSAALAEWSDNVEATAGDRGFMNIFAGDAPF
jgi:FkbM family methyltransferase